MADWDAGPELTQTYSALVSSIRVRDVDTAMLFNGTGTNPPDKTFRWNNGGSRFEIYSSAGATWSAAAAVFEMSVSAARTATYASGAASATVATLAASAVALQGDSAADLKARANHTGTQTLATISDSGSLAALNTVNNSNWSGTDLSVLNGGTGASTESAAKESLKIYAGRVDSAGVKIRLPSGWSVVRDSTGIYTITHNLGVTGYTMVVTCATACAARLTNHTTTTIQYRTHVLTDASAADTGVDFIITVD